MGIRVFTSKIIREGINESELQSLVSKFKQYKESGDTQNYFGRDVSFNRPESVKSPGLMQVHVNDGRLFNAAIAQLPLLLTLSTYVHAGNADSFSTAC